MNGRASNVESHSLWLRVAPPEIVGDVVVGDGRAQADAGLDVPVMVAAEGLPPGELKLRLEHRDAFPLVGGDRLDVVAVVDGDGGVAIEFVRVTRDAQAEAEPQLGQLVEESEADARLEAHAVAIFEALGRRCGGASTRSKARNRHPHPPPPREAIPSATATQTNPLIQPFMAQLPRKNPFIPRCHTGSRSLDTSNFGRMCPFPNLKSEISNPESTITYN